MKKVGKYLVGFIYLIAAIAGIWALFLQLEGENFALDIKTITVENLTTSTVEEKDFNATYRYKGQEVENLWRLSVLIENNSAISIIGEGTQKRIIGTHIKGKVSDGYTFLGYESKNENFPIRIIFDTERELKFFFTQWKPNESVELTMYVEGNDTLI